MILYLMRHGEAVDPDRWSGPDASRPLTPKGEKQLAAAAQAMKRLGFSARRILSSPFVRARQTANVFEKDLGIPLDPVEALSSGARHDAIRNSFRAFSTEESVWIIGHMPDLAVFASRATGQASFLENGFRPGEMLALQADHLAETWGTGTVLFRRTIDEWRDVK